MAQNRCAARRWEGAAGAAPRCGLRAGALRSASQPLTAACRPCSQSNSAATGSAVPPSSAVRLVQRQGAVVRRSPWRSSAPRRATSARLASVVAQGRVQLQFARLRRPLSSKPADQDCGGSLCTVSEKRPVHRASSGSGNGRCAGGTGAQQREAGQAQDAPSGAPGHHRTHGLTRKRCKRALQCFVVAGQQQAFAPDFQGLLAGAVGPQHLAQVGCDFRVGPLFESRPEDFQRLCAVLPILNSTQPRLSWM